MKAKNTIKQIKYDFSNPESQKLFEEFTVILADITKYVENQDEEKISIEEKCVKTEEELRQVQNKEAELIARLELVSSGRYMVKAILKKSINLVYRILSFIPKKLINKFKNSSK